jgi:hypothetical protein
MFGLGRKRKLYNGAVDTKLNNEYQIATRDNSKFPGSLYYLQLIDNAWGANMSEDEAALYIATLYYDGIVKQGHLTEASALHGRIQSIVKFGRAKGLISEKVAGTVLRDVEKISKRQAPP